MLVPSSGHSLPATSGSFLTIADAAKLASCSKSTLRIAHRAGKLVAYRLNDNPMSHTRFKKEDVLNWLGVANVEQGNEGQSNRPIPIALFGRVSTAKQADDLKRQVDRLETFIAERWKGQNINVIRYVGTGSGVNWDRPQLVKLITDIASGKLNRGFVCITHKERLCRFGFGLISQLCTLHSVTIVITERDEEKDTMQELMEDLLALSHVASCKLYGARSSKKGGGAKANTLTVPQDVISDIVKWRQQGLSVRLIFKTLERKGRNKDGAGRSFSTEVVKRILKTTAPFTSSALGPNAGSFAHFWSEKVRIAHNNDVRLSRERLLETYRLYCEERGLAVQKRKAVLTYLRSLPIKLNVQADADGKPVYIGLSLTYRAVNPQGQSS